MPKKKRNSFRRVGGHTKGLRLPGYRVITFTERPASAVLGVLTRATSADGSAASTAPAAPPPGKEGS